MKRSDHLLWVLAEECTEVAHRCSKAARFNLKLTEPGHTLNNAERIIQEYQDLIAAVEMLQEDGLIPKEISREAIDAKKAKVERYMLLCADEFQTLE